LLLLAGEYPNDWQIPPVRDAPNVLLGINFDSSSFPDFLFNDDGFFRHYETKFLEKKKKNIGDFEE
jgi:hypothetical protein